MRKEVWPTGCAVFLFYFIYTFLEWIGRVHASSDAQNLVPLPTFIQWEKPTSFKNIQIYYSFYFPLGDTGILPNDDLFSHWNIFSAVSTWPRFMASPKPHFSLFGDLSGSSLGSKSTLPGLGHLINCLKRLRLSLLSGAASFLELRELLFEKVLSFHIYSGIREFSFVPE